MTTTESLDTSYSLWREWATARRASYRGRDVPDLLSEYVNPVEEAHMTRTPKRPPSPQWNNKREWPTTLFRQTQGKQFNCRTDDGTPGTRKIDGMTMAPWPRDALEYGISTIVSLRMKNVRSKTPYGGNMIILPINGELPWQLAAAQAPAALPSNQARNSTAIQHLHQPDILHEVADGVLSRRRSGHSSAFSAATAHTNQTGSTSTSYATALSTIADISGMHIPPQLHASSSFIRRQQAILDSIMSKAINRAKVRCSFEDEQEQQEQQRYGGDDSKPCAWDHEDEFDVTDFCDDNAKDAPDSFEGQQVELHGSLIKILGRDRVYDALANGTSQIITCLGCQTNMLATSDTKVLYCSVCGTFTPIGLTTSQAQANLQQDDRELS